VASQLATHSKSNGLVGTNKLGYAQIRQKDMEPTRGKCPVGENQQIYSEIGGLIGMTVGSGGDRHWEPETCRRMMAVTLANGSA